jgi:hypothetical protein
MPTDEHKRPPKPEDSEGDETNDDAEEGGTEELESEQSFPASDPPANY